MRNADGPKAHTAPAPLKTNSIDTSSGPDRTRAALAHTHAYSLRECEYQLKAKRSNVSNWRRSARGYWHVRPAGTPPDGFRALEELTAENEPDRSAAAHRRTRECVLECIDLHGLRETVVGASAERGGLIFG